ncbi:hypothetical protein AB0P19_14475 [Microbacterium oleivorans]|uniref:hypothetical protein n=1 Tax=Microbacterium TaxID=33882 RepID=UPI0033CDE82E
MIEQGRAFVRVKEESDQTLRAIRAAGFDAAIAGVAARHAENASATAVPVVDENG